MIIDFHLNLHFHTQFIHILITHTHHYLCSYQSKDPQLNNAYLFIVFDDFYIHSIHEQIILKWTITLFNYVLKFFIQLIESSI